jgi:hypothetical protein
MQSTRKACLRLQRFGFTLMCNVCGGLFGLNIFQFIMRDTCGYALDGPDM